jgi:hypothetical protein
VAFIPPVSPGHVDPESERRNAQARIRANSVWSELLGAVVALFNRPFRRKRPPRGPFGW